MALTILNGPVIEAGESLSDAIDCSSGTLVRLTMPSDWTDAPLTFQLSSDGTFFNDLYGYNGDEIELVVWPGAAIILPPDIMRAVVFIKFRSGRKAMPIPQPERRQFAVAVWQEAQESPPPAKRSATPKSRE